MHVQIRRWVTVKELNLKGLPMRILIATAGFILAANSTSAQSVNIDIGSQSNGTPSSSYAAAGLPGFWNNIDGVSWNVPFQMIGLDGNTPGAMVAIDTEWRAI